MGLQGDVERQLKLGLNTLFTRLKGGAMIGDIPIQDTFTIGGVNSIRGYDEGAIGKCRHYALVTGEINYPLNKQMMGTIFADIGLGIKSDTLAQYDKKALGFCLGGGICMDSPMGLLKLDYAINDHK